jgi:hypothetical protein
MSIQKLLPYFEPLSFTISNVTEGFVKGMCNNDNLGRLRPYLPSSSDQWHYEHYGEDDGSILLRDILGKQPLSRVTVTKRKNYFYTISTTAGTPRHIPYFLGTVFNSGVKTTRPAPLLDSIYTMKEFGTTLGKAWDGLSDARKFNIVDTIRHKMFPSFYFRIDDESYKKNVRAFSTIYNWILTYSPPVPCPLHDFVNDFYNSTDKRRLQPHGDVIIQEYDDCLFGLGQGYISQVHRHHVYHGLRSLGIKSSVYGLS